MDKNDGNDDGKKMNCDPYLNSWCTMCSGLNQVIDPKNSEGEPSMEISHLMEHLTLKLDDS